VLGELPALPELPATGVPAETVTRRPDVTRAWLSVQAADARLASAIADQFPSLSLTVSGQTSAEKVGDLFNDWLGNLVGNLVGPILDGGARRAAVDQKTAAKAEAVNRYGQTVLEAMQEIEDALGREEHLKRYLLSVQNQERLGAEAVERARAAYLGGRSSYFRVLDASRSQLDLARAVIGARSELIRNRVDLYRALAGGIEP
jgi:outer membrane protein TolC